MNVLIKAIVFLLVSSIGAARAQNLINTESADVLWSHYLASIPDCSYKYTIRLLDPSSKTDLIRDFEFTRQADRFIQKEFSPEGIIQDIISFDGKTFYSLFDSGVQLTISSRSPEHNRRFSQRFKYNPLFIPLVALSEGSIGLFRQDFYLPVLADPNVYRKRLESLNVEPSTLDDVGVSWVIRHGESVRTFSAFGGSLTQLVTVVTRNDSSNEVSERWRFDGIIPISTQQGDFKFPQKIFREFLNVGGDVNPQMPLISIEVDAKSIRIHDSSLESTIFQIPKSMARVLRDSDLNTSIELKPDIRSE